MYYKSTLDCQTCGDTIKILSPAEAQKVALNPENYIVDCSDCITAIIKELERENRESIGRTDS